MARRDPLRIRLGFACKESWDAMVGDDRVRSCGGCDRLVFNLSAMTHAEAEELVAAHGVTPCVRFYRRPDGTVMTTDCPTGTRPKRRLAVLASSFAAGTTLAIASPALADPPAVPDSANTPPADPDAKPLAPNAPPPYEEPLMGEMIIERPKPRPVIEWSIWARLGVGVGAEEPDVIARRENPTPPDATSFTEAAIAADLTVGLAHRGDVRLGAWEELRTTSGPVLGGELVVEGLPPHPYSSRIDGTGSLVLRVGGNAHVLTSALGVGYVGSFPRDDEPWVPWARHVVGARVVTSWNRSLDNPRDWSVTVGLEFEPLGLAQYIYDVATGHGR